METIKGVTLEYLFLFQDAGHTHTDAGHYHGYYDRYKICLTLFKPGEGKYCLIDIELTMKIIYLFLKFIVYFKSKC